MSVFRKILSAVSALFLSSLLSSCATTGGGGGSSFREGNSAVERERAAQIAAEPRGDYWIGRRWLMPYCRMWGYVRRPGEPWSKSRLVILHERHRKQPDRLHEGEGSGLQYGYDHGFEYRLDGYFDGRTGYDPNSDLELPLFYLRNYSLINRTPGYLFRPGERYSPTALPRPETQR